MPRYAQLVIGPAGSGKSSYCSTMQKHCENIRRSAHVVNLDPAAEYFDYSVLADIRDLIELEDAMEDEELHFGPNGGLIFCMEYFAQNFDWLHEQLGEMEDDYIFFDCPGQIELYTHVPVMKHLIEVLQSWDFRICAVFLIDAQFMIEAPKFVSGVLCALSAMVNLEVPHINIISKLDLLSKQSRKELDRYLDPNLKDLLEEELTSSRIGSKYEKLNKSIASMIDDYSLVKFTPLDRTDEESVINVMYEVDNAIQYGEDLEPKEIPDDVEDDDLTEDHFAGLNNT